MLSTVQKKFLAIHLKVVPQATTDAIIDLKKTYPDAVITPCRADPTLLRIEGVPHHTVKDSVQGGLDIHPEALKSLEPKRQKELMDGLHSTDAKVRAKTIADFQRSGNERYRFDETYQATILELQTVKGDIDDLQPILDVASPGEKNRMAQIQISHGNDEDKAINTRGVELALQMKADNCYEVVAYVEFFYKIVEDKALHIKKDVLKLPLPVTKPPMSKAQNKQWRKDKIAEQMLDYMGKDALDKTLFDDAKKKIDVYKLAMAPYCKPAYTNAALDGALDKDAKLELAKNAKSLFFTDQVNGGYHLLKHFEDMYGKIHAGDLDKQAKHYSDAATDTVASSDSWLAGAGQTGSVTHQFTKSGFTAYVPVNGQSAALASFF